jgi:hypothetical protein
MNLSELISNLWREQQLLMWSGLGFFVLFLVLGIISVFDSTQILGINRWIKPMKFAVSIGMFLWTLAVYLHFLRGYEVPSRLIAWGVTAMMVGEMVLIILQAARKTTSHFNIAAPFDSAVFAAMGLMIAFSTLLIFFLTFLYFRADFALPAAIVWGLRLGLIIFLLGSIEGGYMSGQLKHTVGAMDGGAGLPFVNWSVTAGDLRVAHFVGLHALQAIPLAALFFELMQNKIPFASPQVLTFVFAAVYFGAFSFVFVQALMQKPVMKPEKFIVQTLNNQQLKIIQEEK